MVSRRQLLSGASAAGAGAVLAGCGTRGASQLPGDVLEGDIKVLDRLIAVENYAVTAYVAGIPLLSGTDALFAKQFLSQDLAHIDILSTIVKRAGVKPHGSNQTYDLGHPRGRTEVLELLHHVEQVTLSEYLDALPELSPGVVKGTAASILANDAQHASSIRGRLGLVAVPAAVVTGAA